MSGTHDPPVGEPDWSEGDNRRCGSCNQLLGPQPGAGRVREYCGDTCRQRAWRRRQDPIAAWLKSDRITTDPTTR